MADCIALISEKGGTGKTLLTVNLAAALSMSGKRVLVVDCDQQGNASDLLLDGAAVDESRDLSAVLLGECFAADAVLPVSGFEASIIPAGSRLAETQVELVNAPGRDLRLRCAVQELRDQYDYILCDCPPGRGLLAIVALAAADRVILPMDGSRHGLIGVQKAIELASQVRRFCADPQRPGAPAIAGIVLNRVSKNKTHQECADHLSAAYGSLFMASIPAAICVDTAGWNAKAVVLSDPTSAPAKAIRELARRIGTNGNANAA